MKTLKFTSLALLIIAVSLFTGTSISYSSSNDDNHLSANDSIYSPPGYMNKEIQQARSLTDKYLANKDKADNKTEATQREVSQKVQVQAVDKPKPQLKQKQSSKDTLSKVQVATKLANVTSGAQDITYKPDGVVVATEKNAQGKIIAETCLYNGVQTRHIYVSNDTSKYAINSIITGIKTARNGKGDVVFIKSGNYTISTNSSTNYISYKSNFSIIGEDVKNTVINVPNTVENRGATGLLFVKCSDTTIKNLTFKSTTGSLTLPGGGTLYQGFSAMSIGWGKNFVIENNIIQNFNQAGISDAFSINTTIKNNELKGMAWSGVYLDRCVNTNFLSNTIHDNTGGGILNTSSSFKNFSDNYTYNNKTVDAWGNNPYLDGNFKVAPQNLSLSTNKLVDNESTYSRSSTNYYSEIVHPKNNVIGSKETADLMRTLLNGKGDMILSNSGAGLVRETPNQALLQIPQGQIQPQNADIAMRLANILKNPSEGQKTIIDVVRALIVDTEKAQDVSGNQSPELKKASDDLLQMVANILLAQAVPDLLNKGDVSNIKAMFSELDTQRNKIMLEYAQSTKPYYENMIKDMAKNMAMLQAKNLLNPNMSKDELSKLPPSELDKILDKIRNMKDKSFEEKYLLQQEAKYRQDYLDPNNKKLESDMKGMLKNFTGRINDVLKSSEKK